MTYGNAEIMLRKGAEEWNSWRKYVSWPEMADLRQADLSDLVLTGYKLDDVNFQGAKLRGTTIQSCDVSRCVFVDAECQGLFANESSFAPCRFENADLTKAILLDCDFTLCDFRGANISSSRLHDCNFRFGTLRGISLKSADLLRVTFADTIISGTDMSDARASQMIWAGVEMRNVRGLETIQHGTRSTIGLDTFYISAGLPERFLRGSGAPEQFIAYADSLAGTPIRFYSCFISYSGSDERFAMRLHADLQQAGIRAWFAPEDLKIGDRLRPVIDESIRVHDKVLLVLSKASIDSQWVEQEVETALARERRDGREVLFPVRLDNTVMDVLSGWAALVRNTRHIGDFTRWMMPEEYKESFDRLARDLRRTST